MPDNTRLNNTHTHTPLPAWRDLPPGKSEDYPRQRPPLTESSTLEKRPWYGREDRKTPSYRRPTPETQGLAEEGKAVILPKAPALHHRTGTKTSNK